MPFAGEPSLDAIEANILCGDPETVAEKLVEFIRIVHPTHMLFYFQVGGYESARAIRSMELWAERVVPMVEQALGRADRRSRGRAALMRDECAGVSAGDDFRLSRLRQLAPDPFVQRLDERKCALAINRLGIRVDAYTAILVGAKRVVDQVPKGRHGLREDLAIPGCCSPSLG